MQMPGSKDLKVFGYVWSALFLILSFYAFYTAHITASIVMLALAGIFAICAFAAPSIFSRLRLYQLWCQLGHYLGIINYYVITLFIFIALFMPIGLIRRLFGIDPLNRKLDKSKESYFITRESQPGSMHQQF